MINKDLKIEVITNPYPIWIIDNLFANDILNEIKNSWVSNDSDLWIGTRYNINGNKNILEQGMKNISNEIDWPLPISNVIKYFHSDKFTKKIEDITGVKNLISDKSMRWTGMRVMLDNSYQLIHSDARKHPDNGLRKELTCLFYLNDDYKKDRDEGCLEIWNDDMSERKHEIEPIDNRFVIFKNSDTSYHGVPKVKRERKALTFSILKDDTSIDRSFAEFVGRPEDEDEVDNIGKDRGNG